MLDSTLADLLSAPSRAGHNNRPSALARRAGLDRSGLTRILSGRTLPGLDTLRRILAALEPPATLDEVTRAEAAWMAAQRARADEVLTPDDIVSGHGVETPGEAA